MKIIVNILFTIGFLFAQQIDWNSKPSPITAIEIYCDTEGIPIYVDGIKNWNISNYASHSSRPWLASS